MRTRTATLLGIPLLALTVACGGNEPTAEPAPQPVAAASALEPTGMYDFVATLGAETRTGTLHIERTANGYGGEARLEGEEDPAVVESLTVEGNTMTIEMQTPGQPVTFELNFTGDAFEGLIFVGSQAVEVTGTRRTG